MEQSKPGRTTIAEFEKLLATSEEKLELLEGEVAFAGGSIAHGILCSRLHVAVSAVMAQPLCQDLRRDERCLRLQIRESKRSPMFDSVENVRGPAPEEEVHHGRLYVSSRS